MRKAIIIITSMVLIAAITFVFIGVSYHGSKGYIKRFSKDNAIEEYKNDNSNIEYTENNFNEYDIHDSYAKVASDTYMSVYTGKMVTSEHEKSDVYINNFILYDFEKEHLYDAFGNETIIPSNFDFGVSEINKKKIIISMKSVIYETLTGRSSDDTSLIVLNCLEIKMLINSNSYYIIYDDDDNCIAARNIFSYNIFIDEYQYIMDEDSDIKYLSNEEINVTSGEDFYNFRYSSKKRISGVEVKWQSYHSNIFDFRNIVMSIDLIDKNHECLNYSYHADIVDENVNYNDFDFYDGKSYVKAYYTFSNCSDKFHVNYYPVDYKVSKDKSYAIVLCHKIMKDKTLSKTFYTFEIKNNCNVSKLKLDDALFKQSQSQVLRFGRHLETLYDSCTLKYKNDNFALIYVESDEKYYFLGYLNDDKNIVYKELEIPTDSKLLYIGLDNYLVFNSESYNYLILYDINTREQIIIHYDQLLYNVPGLYRIGRKLYFLNDLISEKFSSIRFTKCLKIMNETYYAINTNTNKSYIFKFELNE